MVIKVVWRHPPARGRTIPSEKLLLTKNKEREMRLVKQRRDFIRTYTRHKAYTDADKSKEVIKLDSLIVSCIFKANIPG